MSQSEPRYIGEFTSARVRSASSSSASCPNRRARSASSSRSASSRGSSATIRSPVASNSASIPSSFEVRGQRVEVLEPEPLELLELVRKAREAVADPVRERATAQSRRCARWRRRRSASPRAATTSRAGIERLGVQRRPQSGEATADDAQVGVVRPVERRVRIAARAACRARTTCASRPRRPSRVGRRRGGVGPGRGQAAILDAFRGGAPGRGAPRRRRGAARAARPRRGRGRRSRPRGPRRGCPRRCRWRTSRSCRSRA